MRHRHFVAAIERASDTLLFIDAQNLAKIGRAVAEYGEIFFDTLLEQAEHDALGQRRVDQLRNRTLVEGCIESARILSAILGGTTLCLLMLTCYRRSGTYAAAICALLLGIRSSASVSTRGPPGLAANAVRSRLRNGA